MKNLVETFIGAVVLVIAFSFVLFAYKTANLKPNKGYHLIAKFDKADGIVVGSEVKIGGIKIGSVSKEFLDDKTYQAIIELTLDKNIKIPKDSSIQIVSDGLLGGKYMSISPGADSEILADAGQINYTQSSVNLESLIGKMIFNGADKKAAQ